MTDTPAADLRKTSDSLLRDLEALTALEEEKRTIPPSDPRLQELAEHIHEIANRLVARTAVQKALTAELANAPAGDRSIDEVRRSPAAILAEWRAIEQRKELVEEGSAEFAELAILSDRLRREYQVSYDEASRSGSNQSG